MIQIRCLLLLLTTYIFMDSSLIKMQALQNRCLLFIFTLEHTKLEIGEKKFRSEKLNKHIDFWPLSLTEPFLKKQIEFFPDLHNTYLGICNIHGGWGNLGSNIHFYSSLPHFISVLALEENIVGFAPSKSIFSLHRGPKLFLKGSLLMYSICSIS